MLDIHSFISVLKEKMELDHVPEYPAFTMSEQALFSDPILEWVGLYQLCGVPAAGSFHLIKIDDQEIFIHRSTVERLYRIENFLVVRKFTCSGLTEDLHLSHTQGAVPKWAAVDSTLTLQENEEVEQTVKSVVGETSKSSLSSRPKQVLWSDLDAGESLTLNQSNISTLSQRKRKQLKFFNGKFLDGLQDQNQVRRSFVDFAKGRKIKGQSFYLFDFVACFVEQENLFENPKDFNFRSLKSKIKALKEVDPLDKTALNSEVSGWSTHVRFLLQSLPGDQQVPFLRVALFYCYRYIVTSTRLQDEKLSAQLDHEVKSFLSLDDESLKDDMSRVIYFNFKAFSNNRKVLVDEHYLETLVSIVE